MFSYQILSECDLQQLLSHEKFETNESGHVVLNGFNYVNTDNLGFNTSRKRNDVLYVVAKQDNFTIGVLKIHKDHDWEEDFNLWKITFIDVHQEYRQRGVSKGLYHCLNNFVTNDMILVGTRNSSMGDICKIDDIRISIVTNCTNYRDENDFYKKHLGITEL